LQVDTDVNVAAEAGATVCLCIGFAFGVMTHTKENKTENNPSSEQLVYRKK